VIDSSTSTTVASNTNVRCDDGARSHRGQSLPGDPMKHGSIVLAALELVVGPQTLTRADPSAATTKWEYKAALRTSFAFDASQLSTVEADAKRDLDVLGADGWELAAADRGMLFFKRAKK
jgi:hypothetical protein